MTQNKSLPWLSRLRHVHGHAVDRGNVFIAQDFVDVQQEIKRLDGGIQVIILTGLVSMNTVLQSMRWGAEACLFKPLTDFAPLDSALQSAFVKIDRWWLALQDLTDRKRQETSPVSSIVQNQEVRSW